MVCCCISGCNKNSARNADITFHAFPHNDAVRKKWLERIGNPILTRKMYTALKNYRVCSEHFSLDQFRTVERKKLNTGACPTILIREPELGKEGFVLAENSTVDVVVQTISGATILETYVAVPSTSGVVELSEAVTANGVKFPCKYQASGCVQVYSLSESKTHEELCEYKPFCCPVTPSGTCQWVGTCNELLEHCKEHHPDTVVHNPIILTHDITKASVKAFILSAFNSLFIIQVKVCLTTNTIYHSASLISDPTLVSRFRLNLDIENEQTKFSKHREVTEQGCMTLQEDQSIALNINTLVGILGNFRGTTFTVTVNVKCVQCNRVTDLVFCDTKDWRCMTCIASRRQCEYSSKGCTYTDISTKCLKHEWYFCQFNDWCRICKESIDTANLDDHYWAVHSDITHEVNTVWTDIVSDDWIWRIINAEFGKAFFVYKHERPSTPLVFIRTPLTSEELQKYMCLLEFSHPVTGYTLKRLLDATNNDNNDWCVTLSGVDTTLYIHNNRFNVRVNFIKKLSQ